MSAVFDEVVHESAVIELINDDLIVFLHCLLIDPLLNRSALLPIPVTVNLDIHDLFPRS